MSSPRKSVSFFDEPKSETKQSDIKQEVKTQSSSSTSKLPSQLAKRVGSNSKMMSDIAITRIKDAIDRIYDYEKFLFEKSHDEVTEGDLFAIKYRRYTKKEIESALTKDDMEALKNELVNGHLPYSVYHAKVKENGAERVIYAFINKGVKEFKELADSDEDEFEEKVKENILGKGTYGVVKPMQDMDNAAICYALKIMELEKDSQELDHAEQAGLALSAFARFSPSHNRVQIEMLTRYIPGTDLQSFFLPERDFIRPTPPKPPGASMRGVELLSLLKNIFTCVETSVHRFGAMHRDIKLGNFIFDPVTGKIELVDFGHAVTPDKKSNGIVRAPFLCGSPGYIAPESRHDGTYTQKADVYALGVLMSLVLGMVDDECHAMDGRKLLNNGYTIPEKHNKAFKNKIPDKEIRDCLQIIVQILKNKDYTRRPTVVESEAILDCLIKWYRAKETKADSGIHREKFVTLVQALRQKYVPAASLKPKP